MGSHRSSPDTKKQTNILENESLIVGVSHMCGWRIYMQDAHISQLALTNKKLSLFGVFDGHGGAQVAVYVERHFVRQLQKNQNYIQQNYEQALKETFLKMDQLLLSHEGKEEIVKIQNQMRQKENGSKVDQDSHAGCTANVCLITPDFIYVANAGDSRAVASINKECRELSYDHKPDNKDEKARIQKAGGSVTWGRVNGNLNLSRALGDLQYKTNSSLKPYEQMITAYPDVSKTPNKNIDFIIMGCDGIWEVKSSADMIKWVKKRLDENKTVGQTVQQLLDELLAKDNGGESGMDNMSVILIKFKQQN